MLLKKISTWQIIKIFGKQLTLLIDDILNIDENLLVMKINCIWNLPYNISTEILSKWIINLKINFGLKVLVLMFQKEVADRIIAKFNTQNYGRLSILSNWKLKFKKYVIVKT